MRSSFPASIQSLGLIDGIKFYLQKKFKSTKPLKLSQLKHPILFRKTKVDFQIFMQIFVSKEYDLKLSFTPQVIFDLGANVGYASTFFANKYPNAKIWALEPESNNFLLAQKNLSNYGNVSLIKGAVWSEQVDIHVVDKSLGEAAFMIELGGGENTVRAYTISELLELSGQEYIDILKIDIEGAEKEIFEIGFEKWIERTRMIIVETHDRYKDGTSKALFSAISKYNFALDISGENLLLYNQKLVSKVIYK